MFWFLLRLLKHAQKRAAGSHWCKSWRQTSRIRRAAWFVSGFRFWDSICSP